ncbi:peptidoglycan-binding domain-containing protein [Streptomyces sp. NPDC050703]|uniref:peptidoglycan-binding domain-containing protein n=1 Tax=Streptomyces sp. NPDC050703 TaxID=3157218 RepID=UPI00341276A3
MQLKTRTPLSVAVMALGAGLLAAPTASAGPSTTAQPTQTALPAAAAALPICEYGISQRTSDGHMVMPGGVGTSQTRRCILKQGHRTLGVRALQIGLVRCYKARISIDMAFGPATKKALRAAQRKAGVNDDGIFGPNSNYAMRWPEYYGNGNFTGRCIRN